MADQVDMHDLLKIFVRDVEDVESFCNARVIDEDGRGAEIRFDTRCHFSDALRLRNVALIK